MIGGHYNTAGRELLSHGIDSPESIDVEAEDPRPRPGLELATAILAGLSTRTDEAIGAAIVSLCAAADVAADKAARTELVYAAVHLHQKARAVRKVLTVDTVGELVAVSA